MGEVLGLKGVALCEKQKRGGEPLSSKRVTDL